MAFYNRRLSLTFTGWVFTKSLMSIHDELVKSNIDG